VALSACGGAGRAGPRNAALSALVSEISRRFTGCLLGECCTGHIEAVGTQRRYLLYQTGNATGIPDMVFMQGPCKAKYVQVFSCSAAFCDSGPGGASVHAATATTALGSNPSSSGRTDGRHTAAALDIHELLRDTSQSNVVVARHMLPMLSRVPRAANSTAHGAARYTAARAADGDGDAAAAAAAALQGAITVRVPRAHGEPAGTLQIDSLGLQCARDSLRQTGCVQQQEWETATAVGCSGGNAGSARHVIIAQNKSYTASMQLQADAFSLHLHHTEDLFSDPSGAVSVVSLSHRFHPLDRVVEEVHGEQRRHGQVTGLLAASQALLRRNVVAASVRSMGVNRSADIYTGMRATDGAQVLKAMRLASDDKHVTSVANNHNRVRVVQDVLGAELLGGVQTDAAAAASSAATDFRMHHSGALSYAIAHQNPSVAGVLNHRAGLDLQEISMALYSGIAFCHACAYEVAAADTTVHVINASDFSAEASTAAAALAKAAVDTASRAVPTAPWSELRHNFHVQRYAASKQPGAYDQADNLPMGVDCHATSPGLVLFRRSEDDGAASFVGAVYVPPRLVQEQQEHHIAALPVRAPLALAAPHSQTQALLSTVTALAVHTPSSRHALLSSATESLFHLNAVCLHRGRHHDPAMKRAHHEAMRKAWLHTNSLRAARLCGGVTNTAFHSTYAHLSNLAALPLNSAAYWATVPYV